MSDDLMVGAGAIEAAARLGPRLSPAGGAEITGADLSGPLPPPLVIWDNRCLLHRAIANYAMATHRRVLHRTVVRGTVPY